MWNLLCHLYSDQQVAITQTTFILGSVVHFYVLAILVFCCCITNCHTLNGLKQHTFISSQSFMWKPQDSKAEFSGQGLIRSKSRCWQSWALVLRLQGRICFQAYSCWQNYISCSYWTEVLMSLLVVSWELFRASRGFSQVLSMRPLLSSSQEPCFNSFSCQKSDFLLHRSLEKTLLLKGLCN